MRSGKLVHVIKVQRAGSPTISAAGTPTPAWSDLATLRAELVTQATTEYLRNQGATDEELVIFRTRFLAGVTTADRITFGGRAFNIREVVPIGRRRGLEVRAVAIDGVAS